MSTQERDTGDSSVWQEFASQYSGVEWLDLDPLYSIPDRLIDCIKHVMPKLMTEAERKFEKDLAARTEGGFFNRCRFGYPPLSQRFYTDRAPPKDGGWHNVSEAAANIKGMLEENLRERGIAEGNITEFEKKQLDYDNDVRLHQAAYAAWLVTDPQFRHERDALSESWAAVVHKRRRFPDYLRSMVGESAFGNDATRQQFEEYVRFLQRWGLDTFAPPERMSIA